MDHLPQPFRDADAFLAWENQQEARHEFDGVTVTEISGSTVAHQRIMMNLCGAVGHRLGEGFGIVHAMRIRIGRCVRYPDVSVFPEPVAPATVTLPDAVAVFEVLSDETARTDRTIKLSEYAEIPSLQYYVLLEQDRIAATIHHRQAGHWQTHAITEGKLNLPALGLTLPLAEIYARLQFQPPPG